jgi:hypothetical protein
MGAKRRSRVLRWLGRALQLATGVHRIHHIRFGYGWRLPFVERAYFPPWSVRDSSRPSGMSPTYRYGWQRVVGGDFHDCATTGRS